MGHRHLHRLLALCAVPAGLVVSSSALAQDADAIAITSIDLSTDVVELTNNGSGEFDPNGLVLCNFPQYAPIAGADPIPAGGSITLDAAALGVSLGDDQGELGLYTASEFENPDAIVAYVEWGTADHRRSPVAIAAGIWDGTPAEAGALLEATVDAPTAGAEWTVSGATPAGDAGDDGDDGDAGDDDADAATDTDAQPLPETGSTTSVIVLAALALVAFGAGLAAAGRRRDVAGP